MLDLPARRLLLPRLAAGIYAWLYAVLLGLVVLDVVYASELQAGLEASEIAGVFNEISDFLLIPLALVLLSGMAAWIVCWHNRAVRYLVPVSLALPLLALLLVAAAGSAIEQANLGSSLRILTFLAGSLLAMRAAIGSAPADLRVGA
jgi:hypothetical protein